MIDGTLLTGKSLHQWVATQVLLHYLIAPHVLVQLLVAELIGGLQDHHRGVSEEECDLGGGLEEGEYDGGIFSLEVGLQVLHMRLERLYPGDISRINSRNANDLITRSISH
jgi:hypothetical protein